MVKLVKASFITEFRIQAIEKMLILLKFNSLNLKKKNSLNPFFFNCIDIEPNFYSNFTISRHF